MKGRLGEGKGEKGLGIKREGKRVKEGSREGWEGQKGMERGREGKWTCTPLLSSFPHHWIQLHFVAKFSAKLLQQFAVLY